MARVTVEDCIEVVPNRFELVALAAQRTRQIVSGGQLTLERDNDKDTVISLREIAEKTVTVDALKEEVILNHQKYGKVDTMDDSQPQIGAGDEASEEASDEMAAMMQAGAEQDAAEGEEGFEFGDEDVVDADD